MGKFAGVTSKLKAAYQKARKRGGPKDPNARGIDWEAAANAAGEESWGKYFRAAEQAVAAGEVTPKAFSLTKALTGGLSEAGALLAKHPVAGTLGIAGFALPVADWALGLGKDGLDAITGADDDRRRRLAIQDLLSGMNENVVEDRRQQLIQQNTAKLMQMDPALATQLMVGRRLPPAAAVFGTKPRRDLIEEVAQAMSNGEFQDNSGGDPVEGFLGG